MSGYLFGKDRKSNMSHTLPIMSCHVSSLGSGFVQKSCSFLEALHIQREQHHLRIIKF